MRTLSKPLLQVNGLHHTATRNSHGPRSLTCGERLGPVPEELGGTDGPADYRAAWVNTASGSSACPFVLRYIELHPGSRTSSPCDDSSMADEQIHNRIEELVAEEHDLYSRVGESGLSANQKNRLESIRVSLDQCWDLLRQHRAMRESGQNPDAARVRDPEVVERYEQ
jgi:hypothetical protein